MLDNSYNLISLDLSSFTTSQETNFKFANSYNLISLDLSNFDSSKVTICEEKPSGSQCSRIKAYFVINKFVIKNLFVLETYILIIINLLINNNYYYYLS